MNTLQNALGAYWAQRDTLSPEQKVALAPLFLELFSLLENGTLRVQEPNGTLHTWIKEAILLYFKVTPMQTVDVGFTHYYDKIPLQNLAQRIRVVPGAIIRRGAHIGANTIVMPSFINIGAYVGTGCMIDTWATVGSCAQIGNNVHISGGAGIGGVLEPAQAHPTVIEDNCFIGARSEIVEGVHIEHDSVISMGVYIGQSTKIYDRTTNTVTYGRVPAGSVVVPGSLPDRYGKAHINCAVIVKKVTDITKAKVALNEYLREELA